MFVELRKIQVPPGARVILEDVSWGEFEAILADLGEHRSSRLTYDQGQLEIMTPLPEHEDNKEIIGNLVKILLEAFDLEFRSLGSTTFKKPMAQGVEPDQCFYIDHEPDIRGKSRLDLTVDPPPDLVIEIDITSRTAPALYAALGVPELWRFEGGVLQINVLVGDGYQEVEKSPLFPGLALKAAIPLYLAESKVLGRNRVMKQFRDWVRVCQIELGNGGG
ncbi:Uma2 family endonuclease [Spirulina sp. CCNP1310]|uniref:Uma2 family endonuclease n=1 Tax=Spirulina sp. CCNP1310 TaxID=3110249 RepID=UPI002B1EF933|nr:Uma2 family endonuclease [Spirulina sp. CCNP1310]MEA5417830.1 Uma2 family endonuclease [Spirulina sp. CCNP1310]